MTDLKPGRLTGCGGNKCCNKGSTKVNTRSWREYDFEQKCDFNSPYACTLISQVCVWVTNTRSEHGHGGCTSSSSGSIVRCNRLDAGRMDCGERLMASQEQCNHYAYSSSRCQPLVKQEGNIERVFSTNPMFFVN